MNPTNRRSKKAMGPDDTAPFADTAGADANNTPAQQTPHALQVAES